MRIDRQTYRQTYSSQYLSSSPGGVIVNNASSLQYCRYRRVHVEVYRNVDILI